jgi:hypothetical protein
MEGIRPGDGGEPGNHGARQKRAPLSRNMQICLHTICIGCIYLFSMPSCTEI